MRVALTIDTEERSRPAGRDNARRQLDLLRREGVRVTSFVQGRWAQAHPELARRIADDGHLVGNHTYHHVPLSLMTDEGIRATVTRAEEVIAARTGVAARPWFRCPYGDGQRDERVLAVLAGLGYRNIDWDVDPFDWRPGRTTDEVVTAVIAGCRAWAGAQAGPEAGARTGPEAGAQAAARVAARVLLHSWPDVTLAALPLLIHDLRAEGAEFVTVDQL
jgi:peptidoglycan-N-acetylglucosamine deacetylase